MMEPTQGVLYFLLAKERYHPTWPKGSHLWTDFGGGRQNRDLSPEHIAAREFLEETLGQVSYFEEDVLPRTTYTDIAVSLQTKRYLFQFTYEHRDHRFVSFVVQIPWDPEIPERFFKALNVSESVTWDLCYLEKSNLGLFSVPQVQQAITTKGYLTNNQRCRSILTKTLAIVLSELQFHFTNIFQ